MSSAPTLMTSHNTEGPSSIHLAMTLHLQSAAFNPIDHELYHDPAEWTEGRSSIHLATQLHGQ
jgi:hypothetical protein